MLTLSPSTVIAPSDAKALAISVSDDTTPLSENGGIAHVVVSADDQHDLDEWIDKLRGVAAAVGGELEARRLAFKERKRGASSFYFGTGLEDGSRLRKQSVDAGAVRKEGYLDKLGGGEGGKKNWKRRFVVLDDELRYYADEATCRAGQEPKGRIALNAYFVRVCKDDEEGSFCLEAYPKSMTFRASSDAIRDDWVVTLNRPLHKLYEDGYVDELYNLTEDELRA